MRTMKRIAIIALAGLPTACNLGEPPPAAIGAKPVARQAFGIPDHEKPIFAQPPAWGLAMSGGGLRSALFNIGAMKALYDGGMFARLDVISSVSGGSYASYWLYANERAQPGAQFGDASFSNATFVPRVCALLATADFYRYSKLFGLARTQPSKRAVASYEASLKRTFGRADPGALTLAQAAAGANGTRRFPYPIFNATIRYKPDPGGSWHRRLFEFTPAARGNPDIGYRPWPDPPEPLRQVTAMSGAAHWVLSQAVANPYGQDVIEAERIPLFDGGKSENLGAIALIRRLTRNMIVVDAEHDPFYQFGAYVRLREHLREYGAVLDVPGIEAGWWRAIRPDFTDAAYSGTVTVGAAQLDIHYLKMSVTRRIAMQMALEADATSDGGLLQQRFARAVDGKDCASLSFPMEEFPVASWAAHNAGRYEQWFNGRSIKAKVVNAVAPDAGKIYFPQYSTGDQSYHRDQALAFLGLGYLAGRDMVDALKRPRPPVTPS